MVSNAPPRKTGLSSFATHHGLLCGQLVGAVRRVVDDIAAGCLVAEPFTDVSLGGTGPRASVDEVIGPAPAIALYRPEPIADVQQQPGDSRAHVDHRLPDECLEFASSIGWMSVVVTGVSALRMWVVPAARPLANVTRAASAPGTDPALNLANPWRPPISGRRRRHRLDPMTTFAD